MIDTGDSDVPQYINHLRSVLNYEGIDLAHIFISHWHHDHIGGLTDIFDEIKEKTSKFNRYVLLNMKIIECGFMEYQGQFISILW